LANGNGNGNGNGHGDGEEVKRLILEALRIHPEGLTIVELSAIVSSHRQTVAKYILVLEAMDIVYRRRVGSATLHYLKEIFAEQVSDRELMKKLRKKL
jgi:DNA-binding transcriptional ArsR family regulator